MIPKPKIIIYVECKKTNFPKIREGVGKGVFEQMNIGSFSFSSGKN